MNKILVTGGAGFAGHHICEHILRNTDWSVQVLDRLSYAGTLERLSHLKEKFGDRLDFVFHDFRAAFPAVVLKKLEHCTHMVHNGGETHVERSIADPQPFIESNVVGTMHALEAARKIGVEHFVYISTDEVHGGAPDGVDFKENAEIKPSNPYSASKAAAEAIAYAYWMSYKLPVTRTRTMNLFGERQHTEKYIPMCIRKILNGDKVIVHGSPNNVGARKWLHCRNQADALLFLLKAGNATIGETYHIAGEEHTNLEIAELIAGFLQKPLVYEFLDFHSVRLGHDRRYSLDDSKLRGLGWEPPVEFKDSLRRAVEWTMRAENRRWLVE